IIFVSNINCPQRSNTLKYFSSVTLIVNGYSLSLCPSPLGDHAFGTSITGRHAGGTSLSTTCTVSTIGQVLSGGIIVIVYSVSLSELKIGFLIPYEFNPTGGRHK